MKKFLLIAALMLASCVKTVEPNYQIWHMIKKIEPWPIESDCGKEIAQLDTTINIGAFDSHYWSIFPGMPWKASYTDLGNGMGTYLVFDYKIK